MIKKNADKLKCKQERELMVRNRKKIREARKKWIMEACNITSRQVDFIELHNELTKEKPCDIYNERK